jgi:hypothetical protein
MQVQVELVVLLPQLMRVGSYNFKQQEQPLYLLVQRKQ